MWRVLRMQASPPHTPGVLRIQEPESGSGVPGNSGSAAVARMLAVTQATFERRAQLEHALESRIVIEQAKGVIAERYGLELEDAYAVIRRAARTNRVKIRDLVARIRPRQPMPPEIEAALRQRKGV